MLHPPDDIETQAFWRLVGHLDTVLQDGYRELVGGVAGEPEPEVWVGLVWVQLLTDLKYLS